MTDTKMQRGQFVRTGFDTGAMGSKILLGRVIKAGPATYTVEWESGLCNRACQGYANVQVVDDDGLLEIAHKRWGQS